MAKLLLVDAESESLTPLRTELARARHEITVAPSASFALTMLERNRPDVIGSRERLPDIPGNELCAIVRSDPMTKAIPFILLAEVDDSIMSLADAAGVDLLLAGRFPPAALAARITRFVHETVEDPKPPAAARRRPHRRKRVEKPARRRGKATPGESPPIGPGVHGSLAVMDVTEVIQAVACIGKTGRLSLSLEGGSGAVIFEAGAPVHAEFGDHTGEPALTELVSHGGPGGSFAFAPLDRGEVARQPKTIDSAVERLLLGVATRIDERRVESEANAEQSATADPHDIADAKKERVT